MRAWVAMLLVGCGSASGASRAESPRPTPSQGTARAGEPTECVGDSLDEIRLSSTHRCERRRGGVAFCRRHEGDRSPLHARAGVAQMAAGDGFVCFRMRDGTVRCAANPDRRLGGETLDDLWVEVSGVQGAIDIAAGSDFACAVVTGGGVRCWGSNEYGELGDGTTEARDGPVAVEGVTGAVDVEVGGFACARLEDGTVTCWGANMTPTASDIGLSDAAGVAIEGLTGCAWTEEGDVWCWGANESGQAGLEPYPEYDADQFVAPDPRFDQLPEPRRVFGGAQHVTLGDRFGCGLFDGEVRCWGAEWSHPRASEDALRPTRNRSGRGGSAAQWRYSATPSRVGDLCDATAIDAGGRGWCAIRESGDVACSDGARIVTTRRVRSCAGSVGGTISAELGRSNGGCR